MSYYNYFYDDFDSNYALIIYSDEPHLIDTISMLRHYINCHGLTKKLLNYMLLNKLTEDEIDDIFYKIDTYCYGSYDFDNIRTVKAREKYFPLLETEYNKKQEAYQKNHDLVENFRVVQQDCFCNGLGIRRTKTFLNKKIKENDINAKLYKLALEVEHVNIRAKEKYGKYKDYVYNLKSKLLKELINLCKEYNIVYGVQTSDVKLTSHIIYFELPDMEQISFHNSFDAELLKLIPIYEKAWDEKVNSTLTKIENTLILKYNDDLELYKNKFNKNEK